MLKHLWTFPFGFFVGSIFIGLFGILLDTAFSQAAYSNWSNILVGALTIVAGSIAYVGVLQQIGKQDALAESNRQSDLRAAKAVLPLALMTIQDVAQEGIKFAYTKANDFHNPTIAERARNELQIGDAVLTALRDCIRFADPMSAAWLGVVIQKYQTSFSRLTSAMSKEDYFVTDDNRASHISDWVELIDIVTHAFPYSRTEQNIPRQLVPSPHTHLMSTPSPLRNSSGDEFAKCVRQRIAQRRSRRGNGEVEDYLEG